MSKIGKYALALNDNLIAENSESFIARDNKVSYESTFPKFSHKSPKNPRVGKTMVLFKKGRGATLFQVYSPFMK